MDSLKQVAYQNIDGIQSNYKMVNNYPVPVPPNQQILNYGNILFSNHLYHNLGSLVIDIFFWQVNTVHIWEIPFQLVKDLGQIIQERILTHPKDPVM